MRIVLCCFVALMLSARPAQAAWAIDVAWAPNFVAASATTVTFTYGSAVASGALLVCYVVGGHATNGVVTGIEDDSANGSWTQFGQGSPVNTGGLGVAWSAWYFMNSAAATPVVTATFTASVANRGIACGSYTGIRTSSAFDVGAGQGQINQGTGADAQKTGPTGTTAEANELAISAAIVTPGATITAGTGWTEHLNSNFSTFVDVHVQDQNVPSPTTVEGTWTFGGAGNDHQAIVGTFKEPAAAGGCKGSFLLLGVGKCD